MVEKVMFRADRTRKIGYGGENWTEEKMEKSTIIEHWWNKKGWKLWG